MLQVNNLTKIYDTKKVLKEVSFEVKCGEIVGLIGPNGAGKTTIIQSILGLIERDQGDIYYNGQILKKQQEIATHISYIPEQPVYYEDLTVEEHLQFIAMLFKIPQNEYQKRKEFIVDYLNLKEHLKKFPDQLSKGTKQKFMISCGFIREFDLMVADEPFSGLDPAALKNLKDLFREYKRRNKSIIVSTHLLDLAQTFCDRYIFLNKGEIIVVGSQKEISEKINFKNKNLSLEEIFLKLMNK
ncbi:hypothetical protein BBF96_14345 [Anoxybacter fermentans]|uniref:ABC transporter domain-containing protein n=1 Tax=Anoxybacter fermentans TaxID=1323375 RepID=A0A3S9T324_9FIRM|nr:hypothetical protein BBF96_14345 [Anoxybacter fermentans]